MDSSQQPTNTNDVSSHQETDLQLVKKVLDQTSDGVFWNSLDGKIVYANEAGAHLLGYTRDELLTKTVTDLDAAFTMEAAQQLWEVILQQGSMTVETAHRRKDGSLLPIELRLSPLIIDGNKYMCGFARDLSERKATERTLKLAQMTLDQAVDAVFWADMQGHFLYVNNAACEMLGYTQQELSQMNVIDVEAIQSPEAAEQAWDVLRQAGSLTFETEHRRKDGSTFPVEVKATYLVVDGKEHISSIVRDLTDRKRIEEERLALQQEVIDAQGAALRELSTPLIPISDNIVIMPLIGSIDSARAQQVMEVLLEGVAMYQANFAILDITGVQVVDTQVANALIRAAQAVRLLGAQVILTGIQSAMAQTLVHLGADLSSIITRGSLQSGIAYANQQGDS